MRVLYSRLMGLRLFFGKFNTSLIFKPINYFSVVHLVTTAFALVFLSARNIQRQEGYRTSTFYAGVETIIIEAVLIVGCLVDNKHGHAD